MERSLPGNLGAGTKAQIREKGYLLAYEPAFFDHSGPFAQGGTTQNELGPSTPTQIHKFSRLIYLNQLCSEKEKEGSLLKISIQTSLMGINDTMTGKGFMFYLLTLCSVTVCKKEVGWSVVSNIPCWSRSCTEELTTSLQAPWWAWLQAVAWLLLHYHIVTSSEQRPK